MEVRIIKRHLNWTSGQVLDLSEGNAAKLVRIGVAEYLDSVPAAPLQAQSEETAEQPKRGRKKKDEVNG